MTVFRVRYLWAELSPHVYCRVFASERPGATFAAMGNLTMRKAEFEEFRKVFAAEFIDDTREVELRI